MVNQSNLVSLLLEKPAQPEPSFRPSHFEADTEEPFGQVFQSKVDSSEERLTPGAERAQQKRDNPAPAFEEDNPVASASHNPHNKPSPVQAPSQEGPHPAHHNNSHASAGNPASQSPVQPLTTPPEHLNDEVSGRNPKANASAVATLAGLIGSHGLGEEGLSPAAIDTLKETLAGLNIDSETIGQLVDALQNGDAPGLQGILNALRGLLQATPLTGQAAGAGHAVTPLGQAEQSALNILIQAGLSPEDAQQVIQQVRAGNTPSSLTEASNSLSKTAADALAPKAVAENSNGSGNLQNSSGDAQGSAKNNSEAPRSFSGLSGDRLESLASLVSPDKAGQAPTNPLIAKGAVASLLNVTQAGGIQASGALAEAAPGQAPAALAEAAAKGADFVKPAITETYNGRASMEKPITAQIIEKFNLRGFGNQREIFIKLDPPSLGTVRMNVSSSGDSIRATIVAENNVVKSVIESNLTQLKDSMTHQGVKIDSFNVLVGGDASPSAQGHKAGLEFLDQLGREGIQGQESAEEIVTLHRPLFLHENQSISLFA